MQFNPLQLHAVDALHNFIRSPDEHFFLLTGKAGTGKTTVVVQFLEELSNYNIFLRKTGARAKTYTVYMTAPTNKATAVLRSMEENFELPNINVEAMTTHSLLNLKLKNDYQTGKKHLMQSETVYLAQGFEESIVIVDEYSMVDDALLEYIVRDLGKCKIIFLGDHKQIPSVSKATPNKVKDLVPESCFVNLSDVERQAKITCPKTNELIPHPIHTTSLAFREAVTTKSFAGFATIPDYVEVVNGVQFQELVSKYFIDAEENLNNKVLAWRNDTVEEYNRYIAMEKYATTDPQKGQQYIVSTGGKLFTTEETVSITEDFSPNTINTKKGIALTEINHNDVWFIHDRAKYKEYTKQLARESKKNKSWADFFNFTDNVIDIRKPYAQTVHKSQGSTYENVFIDYNDIVACRDKDTVLRMLYVAVSRPTNKLYIYMSNLK